MPVVTVERDVPLQEALIRAFGNVIDSVGGVTEKSAPQINEVLVITLAQLHLQWGKRAPEFEATAEQVRQRFLDIIKDLTAHPQNRNLPKTPKGLIIRPW